MPSNNIIKRRETAARWREQNINKHRENQRIQKIAAYHNPVRKVCSTKDCKEIGERHHPDYSQPEKIIWLCKKHHESLHHAEIRICDITGCGQKHAAKGFCNLHYKRQLDQRVVLSYKKLWRKRRKELGLKVT